MIDIHSHCLPALDDGAKNVSESIDMLTDSYSQGVERCVCTPHANVHRDDDILRHIDKRNQSIELLKQGTADKKILIPELHYGFEVFIDNDISVYSDIEKMCIDDTKCMLVELSYTKYNEYYPEWLYSLSVKGITPILAHVERYQYFDRLFEELDGFKVIYQINASTLMTSQGKKLLNKLYQSGSTVVGGSDMHNMLFRRSKIAKAYKKVEKIDSEIAQDIFYNNAKRILGI